LTDCWPAALRRKAGSRRSRACSTRHRSRIAGALPSR
jgi:hypothetical protein